MDYYKKYKKYKSKYILINKTNRNYIGGGSEHIDKKLSEVDDARKLIEYIEEKSIMDVAEMRSSASEAKMFKIKYNEKLCIMKEITPIQEPIIHKLYNSMFSVNIFNLGYYKSGDNNKYIIMEILNPISLYPEYNSKDETEIKLIHSDYESDDELNLYNIIITNENINIIKQLINISKYLYECCVFHGDIKKENYGIDTKGNIKIFDYDLSEIISTTSGDDYHDHINDDQMLKKYKFAYDIFALGRIIVNLLCDKHIFIPGAYYGSHRTYNKKSLRIILDFINSRMLIKDDNIKKLLLLLCDIKKLLSYDDFTELFTSIDNLLTDVKI